jgi:peptide/nickel transport system ATP-binding protein
MTAAPIIEIAGLSVGFRSRAGVKIPVLRNVDLSVQRGETVGIVGESGSGKSTLALAAMGYLKNGLKAIGGSVRFDSVEMLSANPATLQRIRGGKLALIPQNAGQALTPTIRVGVQIAESLRLHSSIPYDHHQERVVELLSQVRLPDPGVIAKRYPHELSGGQQQRVAIAMALAGEPEALLLDEPTTGLDVTTQAHILELLRDLASRTKTAMVYVSHDIGAIARVCERLVVMYAGEVVMEGPTRRALLAPAHPYARGLLSSIPRISDGRLPLALGGRPPAPGSVGTGCAFADRCAWVAPECREGRPSVHRTPDGQTVRCGRYEYLGSKDRSENGSQVRPATASASAALSVERLAISYAKPSLIDQLIGRPPAGVATVDGIDLKVRKGETIGLVGESGSGKSTILKAIAGLVPPAAGTITLGTEEVLGPSVDRRSPVHRRVVQLVFQNPDESLNPRQTVEEILAQPLKLYFGLSGEALRRRAVTLLDHVRLGEHYLDRYPNQMSGGEKQRVAIARAFSAEPDLVLCDEVTSALDVSVQAAILGLLNRLRVERETTYVFVSHDLAVVRALADQVAVLYQGRLCEIGPVQDVYATPSHPYTEALIGAVLEPEPDNEPKLLAADVVELSPPAKGCPFQRRCPRRIGTICDETMPPWSVTENGHSIRCHLSREQLIEVQKRADR